MNEELDNVIKLFLVETNENLNQFELELIALEKGSAGEETIQVLFRILHSFKGTCGFLGYPRLEKLAHAGENLLFHLREGNVKISTTITNLLMKMSDLIRGGINHIEKDRKEPESDNADFIAQIEETIKNSSPASKPASKEPAPEKMENTPEKSDNTPEKIQIAAEIPEAVRENMENIQKSSIADATIHVDVELLDRIMNHVGELVLARNQVLQHSLKSDDHAFIANAQKLNLITTKLQEVVMKTRMQPVSNVLNQLPRVVRDVSQACGKEVELLLEGGETELDKTLLEAVRDPLLHIVRNAVDHGIESPKEREKKNKPRKGTLTVKAFHESGQVIVEISDDGAGIQLEKIKEIALQKGLITAEKLARLNEREITNLIFLPGLSTAGQVTKVSGRGVGMDVVRTNVEKIGGAIDLHSRPDRGTTIIIKIPLTLAIVPALIVSCNDDLYAIPQLSLLELVRLEGDQIKEMVDTIQGAPVYRLRGELLPLVYLNKVLDPQSAVRNDNSLNMVILQAENHPFGLVVDQIFDTEEIVVKPLSKKLKYLNYYSGATIMGDGKVALILDVLGLARLCNVVTTDQDELAAVKAAAGDEQTARRNLTTLLLFRLGESNQMAVDLGAVARLEEFASADIESAGDREVIQYRGLIIPLIRIRDHVQHRHSEVVDSDRIQVVVYNHSGRSAGLVVDTIVDIIQDQVSIEKADASEGILGTAIIQKRVTQIIDAERLVARALNEIGK